MALEGRPVSILRVEMRANTKELPDRVDEQQDPMSYLLAQLPKKPWDAHKRHPGHAHQVFQDGLKAIDGRAVSSTAHAWLVRRSRVYT